MVIAIFIAAFVLIGLVLWQVRGPAHPCDLVKIRRIMMWITLSAAILVPASVLATFLFPESTAALNLRLYHLGAGPLTGAVPIERRLIAFGFAAVPLSIAVWGLLALRKLFTLYARRKAFSPEASRSLGTIAIAILWYVSASFLAEAPISAALTFGSGHGKVSLSIGLDDLVPLFFASVAAVLLSVVSEARRMARENAEFV